MTSIGSYTLHRTVLGGESSVLLTFDFSQRHEIALGITITSATTAVTLVNVASSDLTLASQAIDSTKKLVQVRVTDASAVVGNSYRLVCTATLADGTILVESIVITVALA